MKEEEFLKSGQPLIIMTLADLREFMKEVVDETHRKLENSIAENQSEVFYSKEQVCRILSINPSTLWNWDKRDYLKPIRVGGMNRYRKSDIDTILGKKRT